MYFEWILATSFLCQTEGSIYERPKKTLPTYSLAIMDSVINKVL